MRLFGTIRISAEEIAKPASSTAPRTRASAVGSHVISQTPSSSVTSSAPASAAASISSSSSASPSTTTTPSRSNRNATEPVWPSEPPALLNAARTFEAVRLRLSVSASTTNAAPPGP